MGDEADVRLVDAHSEGDGRDDDYALAADERILGVRALAGAEAGVIGARVDAPLPQPRRGLLDPAARQAVDDARVAPVLGVEQPGELIAGAALRNDPVANVRPVEAGDEHPGVLQAQPVPDFPPRRLVGGRGKRNSRRGRKPLVQHRELQVFRPEVVAPLRHAVRFVDSEQRDVDLVEQRQRPLAEQPLRGDVEKVDVTGPQPRLDTEHLAVRKRRIEARRPHPGLQEPIDLIAHQRDEGRDDDCRAGTDEGRNLVAERLPAARRHQDQAVAARDRVLDDRLLPAAEPLVAEDATQQVPCRGGHSGIVLRALGRHVRSGPAIEIRPGTNALGAAPPPDSVDDGARRLPQADSGR